jgi:hypothetical protein
MADQLQLRGGTTAETATFTGALREVTVDTDKDTLVVHDNALAGGYPLLRQDLSNLPAGTIDNADINASAAIVDTKLDTIATAGKVSNSATTATDANTASAIVARDASGNFTAGTITAALTGAASSNVLKAGDTMTGALVVPLASAATPSLTFTGDLNTGIFSPGADTLAITTAGTNRLHITSGGLVGIGTSTPGTRFHIAEDGDTTLTIQSITGSGQSPSIRLQRGTYGADGFNDVRLYNTSGALLVDNINSTGAATNMLYASTTGVGIGTASPGEKLTVVGSDNSANFRVKGSSSSGDFFIYNNASTNQVSLSTEGTSTDMAFAIGGYEAMKIDTGKRLLVGTSSATAVTDGNVSAQFEVEGTTTATSAISIIRNSNDTNAGGLIIAKSRGTAAGSNTLVGDGDSLGFIQFQGADGTQKRIGAIIAATADAATGSNDLPTRLTFSTTADGASSPTERMRIASSGTTTITGGGTGTNDNFLAQNSSSARILALRDDGYTRYGTATNSPYNFGVSTSTKAMFMDNGGGFGFNSSIRASKTNIETAPTADWINNLDVVTFSYRLKNEDGTYSDEAEAELRWGVIAENAEQVNPDFCSYDSSGKLDGFHYDRMIPVLLKAIQELKVEVADLKAQLS